MVNAIVKFKGMHIDLDKIVSITDAYFVDRMGHGGYFAQFRILVQLRDEPIEFTKKIGHAYSKSDRTIPIYDADGETITGVREMQEEADKLIKLWMEYKNAKVGN